MGQLVDVLGAFAVLQVTAGRASTEVFDSWRRGVGGRTIMCGMLRLTRGR